MSSTVLVWQNCTKLKSRYITQSLQPIGYFIVISLGASVDSQFLTKLRFVLLLFVYFSCCNAKIWSSCATPRVNVPIIINHRKQRFERADREHRLLAAKLHGFREKYSSRRICYGHPNDQENVHNP